MNKSIPRILALIGIVGALYYFSPQIAPLFDKTFDQYAPKLGLSTSIKGAFTSILPKTDAQSDQDTNNPTSQTEVSESSKSYTQDAQEKILDFTQKEVEKIKDSASTQFCQVLVEKVKTNCEDSLGVDQE